MRRVPVWAVLVLAAAALGVAGLSLMAAAQVPPPGFTWTYAVLGCIDVQHVNGSLLPVPLGLNVTFWYNGSVVFWNYTVAVAELGGCPGYRVVYTTNVTTDQPLPYSYLEVFVEQAYAGNITNFTILGGTYAYAQENFTIVDDVPPTAPSGLAMVTPPNVAQPSFSWSPSTDNLYLEGYRVEIVNASGVVVSDFTRNTSWASPVPLADGWYTLVVTAVDYAGNTNSSSLDFLIDTTPPLVVVEEPLNNSIVTSQLVNVSVLACDASGVADIDVYVDGGLVSATLTPVNATCTRAYAQVVLADGSHYVEAVAYDNSGAENSVFAYFIVDTEAPSVAIVEPVGTVFSNDTLGFVVEASNGASGVDPESLVVIVDGVPVNVSYSYVQVNASAYRFEFTLGFVEGWHNVTVLVSDYAGFTGSASKELLVDLTAPTVVGVEPAEASIVGVACFNVTASASDALSGVSWLAIYINGVLIVNATGGGAPSLNATGTYCAASSGAYEATAVAADVAGNTASTSWWFTVDIEAPVIVVYSPVNDTWYNTSSVAVDVLVNDPTTGIADLSVFLDGAPVAGNLSEVNATALRFTAVLNASEGIHTLSVVAVDAANHSSSAVVYFGVDLSPPVVEIRSPSPGYTSNTTVVLDAYVCDLLSGVAAVEVTVDGSPVNFTYAKCTVSAVLVLGEGNHTITVWAVDNVGYSTSASTWVYIDTTPPTVEFLEPLNGTILPAGTVWFNASVYDSVGVSGWASLAVDGVVVPANVTVVNATYMLVYAAVNVTATGWHNATLVASDLAGNNGSAAVVFGVDADPPVVVSVTPAPGSIVAMGTVAVSAYVADEFSGVNASLVELYVDGSLCATGASEAAPGVYVVECTAVLGDGWHNATVVAYDMVGNRVVYSWVFAVDTTPPSITVYSPVNGTAYMEANVSFQAIACDGLSGVAGFSVVVDSYTVNGTPVNATCWEINTTLLLDMGNYTASFTAIDAVGNAATVNISFSVIIDVVPPTIVAVEPAPNATLAARNVTVAVVACDAGTGVDTVASTLAVDGTPLNLTWTSVNETCVRGEAVVTLSDGWHTAETVVYDNAGNNASYVWSFLVDATPPVIHIASPVNGTWYNTSVVSVIVYATDQLTGVASITVSVDGAPIAGNVTPVNETTVLFTANVSLGDGWHTVSVSAADGVGNAASSEAGFGVDTAPPTVVIVSPQPGYTSNSTVEVEAYVCDAGSGVEYAALLVDGTPVNYTYADCILAAVLALGEGNHTITVWAVDNVGYSAAATTWVYVDQTPPVIVVVSPVDGAWYYTSSITVVVEAADSLSGVAGLAVSINGTPIQGVVEAVNGTLVFKANVTLADGTYTLEALAWDMANNTAAASAWFGIDTVPPIVEIYSPTPGYTSNATVVVEAYVCDVGSGVAEVELLVDDSPANYTYADCSLTAMLVLGEGNHTITIMAVDGVGHATGASVWVYIDWTPPTITVHSPQDGAWYNVSTMAVVVEAADALSGTAGVMVSINGTPVEGLVEALDGTLVFLANVTLGDGVYVLEALAWDMANNTAVATAWFGVDTVPPVVDLAAPQPGYTNNATAVVEAYVCDELSGVASIALLVNGVPVEPISESYANCTYEAHVMLPEANNTITLLAVDEAGNAAADTTWIVVDLTPPSITVTYGNDTTQYKDVVRIEGYISDAHMSAAPPSVNDTRFVLDQWDPETGFYRFVNATSLPDGSYALTITYSDLANNTATALIVFDYVNAQYINVTVYPGWNLLGISLEPVIVEPGTVFDELIEKVGVENVFIYYYNATTGQWMHWNIFVKTLRELHVGMGVWVYVEEAAVNQPVTIRLWGLPATPEYRLEKGWNMVAVTERMDPGDFLPNVSWVYLLAYDPVTDQYIYYIKGYGGPLTELVPGQGYWIYVR